MKGEHVPMLLCPPQIPVDWSWIEPGPPRCKARD